MGRYLQVLGLFFAGIFLPVLSFAQLQMPALDQIKDYRKNCASQWAAEYHAHRHLGHAICSCLAYSLNAFQDAKQSSADFPQQFSNFFPKAARFCITEGVLENTISRSQFDSVSDAPTIGSICDSSWVGIMGNFHPNDPHFNSKNICQCAVDDLTALVAKHDELTPIELRAKVLSLANKCDVTIASQLDILSVHKPNELAASAKHGKFILEIKDDPNFQYFADYLRKHGELNQLVAELNQRINIPYDIHIVVGVSGIGTIYTSASKTITLDYQMMAIISALYQKYYPKHSEAQRWQYLDNVNAFLLYHELGHALIDAYKLPVLGQQEDAADALGAILSLNYNKLGYVVLLDSADSFNLLEKTLSDDKSAYWDEHALNKQRYFRLLCYAYGKYPEPVKQMVKQNYQNALNEFLNQRADYCQDEYDSTYQAWMGFLKPYLNK